MLAGLLAFGSLGRAHPEQKPNILVIMGDDVGYWNLSTYNQGMDGLSNSQPRSDCERPGSFTIGKALDSLYRNSNGSD